jgi:hypothetical protein
MMFTKMHHDAALHVLARKEQYGLNQAEAYDISQVANGYVGTCDAEAGERGVKKLDEIMRAAHPKGGETR